MKYRVAVFTILILPCLHAALGAQEQQSQETGLWGGLALGGTGEHISTLFMGGSVKGNRLLSVRWNFHLDGAFIFAGLADTNYVTELGVLYGLKGDYRWFQVAVSGGPGWVKETTVPGTSSDTEERTESSVGLMLGAEATLVLQRSFAIGVQGYGGVSSLETLWGVGWVLKFGQLRPQRPRSPGGLSRP